MVAWDLLLSLDVTSLVKLFWYTALFEMPRYMIGILVVALAETLRPVPPATPTALTLSVILAGHNESGALRRCVNGLAEQTIISELGGIEVIVIDDGSTDRMFHIADELRQEGKVDQVLRIATRSGKSAAVNLGLSSCTGDIVIISDVDTTFDRDAFSIVSGYFSDPNVGAVSGNLGVRNASVSLTTRHQAIEYAITISLGRNIQDALGILSTVSGAFGAFRRTAIEQVGGQDVEVGEDADLTMKLRRAGWTIRFAPNAHALTDVPETTSALIAQRLRWDRGLVAIWMRKFRSALDCRHSNFRLADAGVLLEVILFQVLLPLAFPIYLVWLFHYFAEFAFTVLGATLIGYAALNLLAFSTAAFFARAACFKLTYYLPLYSISQVTLMRFVRILAIVHESVFAGSFRDPYVPARVMSQVEPV